MNFMSVMTLADYEELRALGKSTAPTRHETLKIFIEPSVWYEETREDLETLGRVCVSARRGPTHLALRANCA